MCSDLKRWFYDEMPTFAHPISMQVSGRRYFLARLTWWLHRYNMQPCTRCPWAKLWDGFSWKFHEKVRKFRRGTWGILAWHFSATANPWNSEVADHGMFDLDGTNGWQL